MKRSANVKSNNYQLTVYLKSGVLQTCLGLASLLEYFVCH